MDLQTLVSTSSLKTKKLARLAKAENLRFHYDEYVDMLMILFVPPETETVAHYIDEHVAVLYESRTKEIVGLQIESFQKGFLPKHINLQKVWKLTDAVGDEKPQNINEMILKVEEVKPLFAKEVVRLSRGGLGKQAAPIEQALEFA